MKPNITPSCDINPALSLMAEFGQLTHGVTRHISQMREDAIFSDGALPARFKVLAAMVWSISARCEPCLKFYVQKAVDLGATKEELGEALAVAATMGGCVGEMWALKAYQAYKEISGEQRAPEVAPSCCVR